MINTYSTLLERSFSAQRIRKEVFQLSVLAVLIQTCAFQSLRS